jgi:hypothetical protein
LRFSPSFSLGNTAGERRALGHKDAVFVFLD